MEAQLGHVASFAASADRVRLVQEILAIPRGGFRVLVDSDDDCLDVVIAPSFPRGLAPDILKGFQKGRQLALVIEPAKRYHLRPPRTFPLVGPGCAYRKSNPAILMVQSAQDRTTDNASRSFGGARYRRVLVQRQVSARAVIIIHVREQNVAQMAFAKYHDMIHAFPADRADESFRVGVLPG
jgi:hypothetical protein